MISSTIPSAKSSCSGSPLIFSNATPDTDATRLRKTLQACRYVYAIPEDVLVLNHDVALMYAHPKLAALFLGHLSIALGHPALNLNGTPNCIHHAGELDQHAVPG